MKNNKEKEQKILDKTVKSLNDKIWVKTKRLEIITLDNEILQQEIRGKRLLAEVGKHDTR